ncbi:unnamed protein product [Caenorhabditis auriculariae]|uniref:Uncharacterized protein n=1 Tax=Caenorhabditis auriculariae TaxID=2777116 RepID=A0A8S1HWU0_9PELO|nr:unnamed protein product [Caenorhabditis auriculariae]
MVLTRTGRSTRRASTDKMENIIENDEGASDTVSDSDDDMPEEVPSKKNDVHLSSKPEIPLVKTEEPTQSIYEQVKLKRQAEEARAEGKRAKEKSRRKAKRIAKGVFQLRQNKAEFQVVTLKEGIQHSLEPVNNFREDLLRNRTANSRVKNVSSQLHRAKWASMRN